MATKTAFFHLFGRQIILTPAIAKDRCNQAGNEFQAIKDDCLPAYWGKMLVQML
jgi:hypothetical protein